MSEPSARDVWQKKVDLLLAEEAKACDPAAKFKIQQDIAEARAKLRSGCQSGPFDPACVRGLRRDDVAEMFFTEWSIDSLRRAMYSELVYL